MRLLLAISILLVLISKDYAFAQVDNLHPFESLGIRLRQYNDEKISEFIFKDINGKDVKLSSFKGKYVLLDFWETVCVPCLQEVPLARKLHNRLTKYYPQVVLLTISSDKNVEKWKQIIAEKNMPGLNLLSTRDANMNTFHVKGWPTYILLNPESKIMGFEMPTPGDGPFLEYLIYKALKGIYPADAQKTISVPEKGSNGYYASTPEFLAWIKEVNWTK